MPEPVYPGDDVRIKSGRLKDSIGILDAILHEPEDAPAYRVRITEVSALAASKGYRLDDEVDFDLHEIEKVVQQCAS